jgi:hypothetical protein
MRAQPQRLSELTTRGCAGSAWGGSAGALYELKGRVEDMANQGAGGGWKPDIFDEREKAFEAKYRHDEEIAFRANARCAHLLGLWVAMRMGLAGVEAEAYSQTLREADLRRPNHLEMLRKAAADLAEKGIKVSDSELTGQRETLLEEAKKQILGELREGKQQLEPGL